MAVKLNSVENYELIEIVILHTNRDDYNIEKCADKSLSVSEVINILSRYPDDAKVVFSNDNGYTYGIVKNSSIHLTEI